MPPTPTYEEADRAARDHAILQNNEQLIWHAHANTDSLANTALQLQRSFYGLPPKKPLFTDAVHGERIPDAVRRQLDDSLHPSSPSTAKPAHADKDRDKQGGTATPLQHRPRPRPQAEDASAGAEGPAGARSRRARSERSSGGSQTASAKKRVRKSLGSSGGGS